MNRNDRALELETLRRNHVEALLDISEESFMKDLQPYEWHCYSGWEHAVQGWARVSPMSCIIMNQKSQDKAKQKEANNSLTINQTSSKEGSTSGLVEQHYRSNISLPSLKESGTLNQQQESWCPTKRPVHDTTQECLPSSLIDGNIENEKMLQKKTQSSYHLSSQSSLSHFGVSKAKENTIKHDFTVVPIKNHTFLPPINSWQTKPKVNIHPCRSKMPTPEVKTIDKLEKRTNSSQTKLNFGANSNLPTNSKSLTYNCKTCQKYTSLFPAVNTSAPVIRQLSIPPKHDTLHPSRYSWGRTSNFLWCNPWCPPGAC